jgi:hypothetical protein
MKRDLLLPQDRLHKVAYENAVRIFGTGKRVGIIAGTGKKASRKVAAGAWFKVQGAGCKVQGCPDSRSIQGIGTGLCVMVFLFTGRWGSFAG